MSTVMMPEEFQSWSQHLQLSKETEALFTAYALSKLSSLFDSFPVAADDAWNTERE
jgi:hypothetical protein